MLALAAVRAVVVAVIDVREGRGFELCVFHAATVAPIACGLLRYNLYSVGRVTTLYADFARSRRSRSAGSYTHAAMACCISGAFVMIWNPNTTIPCSPLLHVNMFSRYNPFRIGLRFGD
jgi:hypothetical protein